jgi:6-pyruvoyl-tetrahydropterin synthase
MEFDHHLLLNEKDPWAQPITVVDAPHMSQQRLPGLQIMPGDPTTENLSKWIAEWAANEWSLPVQIKVQETPVNGASYSIDPFKVTNAAGEHVMTLPQGGTKH